jgi:Family of unknown function (DUF5335)
VSTRAIQLNDDDWYEYFNSIARNRDRTVATVALPPEARNARPLYRHRALHGIRYDSDADLIEVALGHNEPRRVALRYFVSAPRSIVVEESDHMKLIFVDDARGEQTLIWLFDLAQARDPGLASRRSADVGTLKPATAEDG